ncbi:golgin candidate 5-like [Lactuca sativa]|uniref:golgin candidate 5-like n=1 Tax=Lactuca sativa TaxID=4236 RepID=UPI0022B07F3A|nr:golgin candidate 5-like [Lactuca sativa]
MENGIMDELARRTNQLKLQTHKLRSAHAEIDDLKSEREVIKSSAADVHSILLHLIEGHDPLVTITTRRHLGDKLRPALDVLSRIEGVPVTGFQPQQEGEKEFKQEKQETNQPPPSSSKPATEPKDDTDNEDDVYVEVPRKPVPKVASSSKQTEEISMKERAELEQKRKVAELLEKKRPCSLNGPENRFRASMTQVYALTRERDTLHREQNKRSDATALLKEKDDIITQVMEEDQKDEIEELEASLEALAEELDKNIVKGQVLESQVNEKVLIINSLEADVSRERKLVKSLFSEIQTLKDALKAYETTGMELAKVQEANKRIEMEPVQLETNLIEMETLVESRTCELLEVRKELEMSQAPAEENEAIATESKQLLKQVNCMVTVLENQVPAFEEQIHSNVVVAYAMDLLDLVQKVLNACVRQKKSRRGILGIAAAKGTGTTT